jgi:predicted TIM-barrel fold metal-dependent hydrolase
MIIDVHTHNPQFRDAVPADKRRLHHTWRPDRSVESVYSWDDYLAAQAPADKSIVFGVAWAPGEATGGVNGFNEPGNVAVGVNDATSAFARAYPERLIGFMSVHPHDPDALAEIERARTDLGLRGIKMGANYQVFDPLESRALAIYREAERHGLPILFHIGTSPVRMAPIRYAHPLVVDEIAMRYPGLRIIMAHMGHPWTVDSAVVVRKHPNVYGDVSGLIYRPWTFYEGLLKASEWNVLDKLLFASDYPITTPAETLHALRHVNDIVEGTRLPRVPERKIEEIIHRDSLALLGLS